MGARGGKALERLRLRARRRPPRPLTGFPSACKLALKYSPPLTYCSGRRGDAPVANLALGPVCDPPCAGDETCEDVPDVGPTCVPPAGGPCTPVEACDHGACIGGTCKFSQSNDMMVCVPDGGSPKCASTPANVCDAQPGGDPACVWPCPGYYDAHGDPVEEPTLCLPGEMCIDGAFCG